MVSTPLVRNEHDLMRDDRAYFWWFWSAMIIMSTLLFFYVLFPIQNTSIVHNEVDAAASTPFSARGRLSVTMSRIGIFSLVAMIAFPMINVIFRANFGCSIISMMFFLAGGVFLIINIATLWADASAANIAHDYGNLFNDRLYCCLYPGTTGCPNVIPCPGISDLSLNGWAIAQVVLLSVFAMFAIAFAAVYVAKWIALVQMKGSAKKSVLEDESILQQPTSLPISSHGGNRLLHAAMTAARKR